MPSLPTVSVVCQEAGVANFPTLSTQHGGYYRIGPGNRVTSGRAPTSEEIFISTEQEVSNP